MKKIAIYVIIGLGLLVVGLSIALDKANSDKKRFKANQAALLHQVDTLTTKYGKSAAEALKLSLTVKELENSKAQYKELADELNIKLKRVQSISSSNTKTDIKIVTQVRDSIVYRDSIITPVKVFAWSDAWVDIRGKIDHDSVDLSLQSVDTLTTIVHKIPHKFLFFKWGCKAIKQTIVSSNPHTKITYTEYIELNK